MTGYTTTPLTTTQANALRRLHAHDDFDDRNCRDAIAWDVVPMEMQGGMTETERNRRKRDVAAQIALRKRLCGTCPVLAACRAYADTGVDVTGVLAGRTDDERARRAA